MSVLEVPLDQLLVSATLGFAHGEHDESGVFQVRMNNVTSDGGLDLSKRRRVPRSFRNLERYAVQSGDVLFNATNSPELVGKAAYFPGLSETTVFSNHFIRLRPNDQVEGRYLAHWLVHQFQQGRFRAMCRQWVNQATVSRESLLAMRIPLPKIAEQRLIADVLDKADALRAKRRASMTKLNDLKRAKFVEAFGDSVTNSKCWPVKDLGMLIVDGPQNGIYKPASKYGSGTRILRIDGFYDGAISDQEDLKRVQVSDEEREKYGLRPADIVINRVNSREYLGKCALVPELSESTLFESNMMRFAVDTERISPWYLIELLQTAGIRAHILSSAKDAINQSSINQRDVATIPVMLPPIRLQDAFAKWLRNKTTLEDRLAQSANAFDSLFASLQHRAFRGELTA